MAVKPKLNTADRQMIALIDKLRSQGTIRFQQEFCDAIGMPKQNIRNVKNGIQHFTTVHIENACRAYKIDANWIFGLVSRKVSSEKILGRKSRKRRIL